MTLIKQEEAISGEHGILNVNQLKYIAAFFMVLDNALPLFGDILPSWIHLITRFVAPLFAFLMVEGFFHTRSRKQYLLRLWAAALLMQFGNVLSYFALGGRYQIQDNIFLTLAVGFSLMCLLEAAKTAEDKKKKTLTYVAFGAVLAASLLFSLIPISVGDLVFGLEGGMQLIPVILIFYLFNGNRKKQVIVFLIWNILFIAAAGGVVMPGSYENLSYWFEDFCYNSDLLVFLFLPFLLLYNGRKGRKTSFDRYFFYVFYPAHLWLLHLLGYFMKSIG